LSFFLSSIEKTQKISMKKFLTAIYIVRNRKPEKNEITESLRIFDTE